MRGKKQIRAEAFQGKKLAKKVQFEKIIFFLVNNFS